MRIPHIDNAHTRTRALELLRDGGVVVLPTDTLYGLHAVVSHRDAVDRIAALKGVGGDRRFLLLASSLEMATRYIASTGCATREQLADAWPAPVTVILPAGGECPEWMGATVGFRVPAHDAMRELVAAIGEPLVSTSVNTTGEAPLNDPQEIAERFAVDMVVDGGVAGRSASTIVDVCGETPLVLRRGDYDWPTAAGDSNPSK